MKSIVFVFQRNIYPKTSGYPLRASRWLEAFAGKANNHVIFVNARPMNKGTEKYLASLGVTSFRHIQINPFFGALNSIWYFITRLLPLQVGFYNSFRVRRHMRTIQNPDLVIFSERRVGYYTKQFSNSTIWVDLCDLVDDNYKTGASRMNLSLYKLYYLFEWPLLRLWDKKIAKRADRTFLVTEYFARMLARRLNGNASQIKAIENGINIELSTPKDQSKYGYYFIGPLSYKPNIDALNWFLENVEPFLSRRFYGKVIGVNAPRSLRKRLRYLGIKYVPFSRNLDLELADYGTCIAPMISGGGLLNKCLEAFNSGRIVLLSPRASTGFKNIQNGVHALVCDKPEAWLQAFDDIGSGAHVWNPEQVKNLVKEYSWRRFDLEAEEFLTHNTQ